MDAINLTRKELENYRLRLHAARHMQSRVQELGIYHPDTVWLVKYIQDNQRKLRNLEQAVGVLEKQDRILLESIYMTQQHRSAEEICGVLGMSRSSLYRYRQRALENLSMALYGRAADDPAFVS